MNPSDEAVEAAAEIIYTRHDADGDAWGGEFPVVREEFQETARAALKAAYQVDGELLGTRPQPTLDADAVRGVFVKLPYLERSDSEELPAPSAMPDREALVDAIGQATGHVAEMDQHEEGEWENGCASCANWGYPCATLSDAVDAVLTLLNGSESCLGDGVCTNPKCPVHGIKEEPSDSR